MKRKRTRSGHIGILSGFRVPDKISLRKRYIHKESYHYKVDAEKELKRRRDLGQDVIMRKYKDGNNKVHWGIFQRSVI